jgi:uncharacterized protein (TIGR01777 family)
MFSMATILVSGATGYLGGRLVQALPAAGFEPVAISRDPAGASRQLGGIRAVSWKPKELPPALEGAAGVVHLAGRSLAGRWNKKIKRELIESRVQTLSLILQGMSRVDPARRPKVLISASAVGYYGPLPAEQAVDESGVAGGDFMARLCSDWELVAEHAEELGVRVVCARMGVVFGPGALALSLMALPFKFFVGGPLGSGEQVISWIHLDDALRALTLMLKDDTFRGAVNLTTPYAVTNREFSEELGRALHRPSWFRVPGKAIETLLAEGSQPVLGGQRVIPRVLMERGFEWSFPTLPDALRNALAK